MSSFAATAFASRREPGPRSIWRATSPPADLRVRDRTGHARWRVHGAGHARRGERVAVASSTVGIDLRSPGGSATGRRRGRITSGGARRRRARACGRSRPRPPVRDRSPVVTAGPGSTSPCLGCAGRSRSTCIRRTRKRRAAPLTADVTMPQRRSDGRSAGSVHMTTRTRSIGRSPPSSIGTTSSSRRAPSRSNGRVDVARPTALP